MWSPVISNIQPLWKPAALLAEVSLSKTFDSSSLFGNWPWLPTSVDLDNDIHLFIIPWGIVLFVQLILFVIMNVWICFVWRSGGVCGCSKRLQICSSNNYHADETRNLRSYNLSWRCIWKVLCPSTSCTDLCFILRASHLMSGHTCVSL